MGNGRIFLIFGKEEVGFVEYDLKCFFINWHKYNQTRSKVVQ